MRRLAPLALLLFVVTAAATARFGGDAAQATGQPCGAGTNGSQGYAYAGYQATTIAHGVRATITPTAAANVLSGHVAGWIGVGGPGQGMNGETLWLQVGVASMPQTPPTVYAEITRGGEEPVFVPLLQDVQTGESHRVAVLEMSGKPNWWRVWLDGQAVTEPVLLANSTDRWRPIATAESWDGGRPVCNSFAYRFDGVGVASATGGSWRPFTPGFTFQDRGFVIRRLSVSPGGQRTLAELPPAPYAFEASSLEGGRTRIRVSMRRRKGPSRPPRLSVVSPARSDPANTSNCAPPEVPHAPARRSGSYRIPLRRECNPPIEGFDLPVRGSAPSTSPTSTFTGG